LTALQAHFDSSDYNSIFISLAGIYDKEANYNESSLMDKKSQMNLKLVNPKSYMRYRLYMSYVEGTFVK
jgi:hypothetical protein